MCMCGSDPHVTAYASYVFVKLLFYYRFMKPVFQHMHALMQHVQKSIHTSRVLNILCLNARIYFLVTFLCNFPLMRLIKFKILQIQFSSFRQLPV